MRGPWLSAAIDINAQHEPLRGGSWHNHAQNLRSAYRNSNDADNRDDNIGFRVAAPPPNTLLCCREHRAGVSFAGTTLQGWLG
ncbi:MAG: SUMF1/EgtB/PvdO family nonheme iron enzyme [Proteobacteria bacterium]|nr:SUMF1/EgtB/PvdO family nonheme iron enzyme [Pseudomonadota bacterium]